MKSVEENIEDFQPQQSQGNNSFQNLESETPSVAQKNTETFEDEKLNPSIFDVIP